MNPKKLLVVSLFVGLLLAGAYMLYASGGSTPTPADRLSAYVVSDMRVQTSHRDGAAGGAPSELTTFEYRDLAFDPLSIGSGGAQSRSTMRPLALAGDDGQTCAPSARKAMEVRLMNQDNQESLRVPETTLQGIVLLTDTADPYYPTTVSIFRAAPGVEAAKASLVATLQTDSQGIFRYVLHNVAHGESVFAEAAVRYPTICGVPAPTGPGRSPILTSTGVPQAPVTTSPADPGPGRVRIPILLAGTVSSAKVESPITLNLEGEFQTVTGARYVASARRTVAAEGGEVGELGINFDVPANEIRGEGNLIRLTLTTLGFTQNRTSIVETREMLLRTAVDAQGVITVKAEPAKVRYNGLDLAGMPATLDGILRPKVV